METQLKDQLRCFDRQETSDEILQEAFAKTVDLYDVQPTWIPLFFGNYKLHPWHGGCAWIFQQSEDSPTGAFFQLRQAFRQSKTYLGIYSRGELIAHEVAHVGRMMFREPKFEEVLAYRSSSSAFRRWFGPLVEAPWESALFVFVLLCILLLDIGMIATGFSLAYKSLLWLKLIPVGMLLYAFARTSRRQMQVSKCLQKLQKVLGNEQKANAVLYRLQDEEIKLFGRMKQEELLHYVEHNKSKSLRWRLLALAYFPKN